MLVEATVMAYECQDYNFLRARHPGGMSISRPFLSVSVEDISAAARWASPHTVVSLLPQWDCALTATLSLLCGFLALS